MTHYSDNSQQAQPCRPFGFWASTGIGILAVAAWGFAQWLAAVALFAWSGEADAASADASVIMSGLMLALVTLVSAPVAILVLAAAASRRCPVTDYLSLHRPARRELLLGIAILAVLLPLGDLSSYLSGRELVPAFVVEAYRSARAAGLAVVALLALALIVAAPLMEELLFRGFLYRGYAQSRLGSSGAILVTAAAWAAMHVQYEFFYMVQIFLLGCVFGWLRWRSHSVPLTVVLHGLVNLVALLQVAYLASRASP